MKTDTCLFTRIRQLHLCVKQSFPSLSEVFTHGSQCGDTTNTHLNSISYLGCVRLGKVYLNCTFLSSEKSGKCSEGFLSHRGNVRENGQVCAGLVSLFPCGLSHVEVLICSPPGYCHDACVGSITAPPPPPPPALSVTLPSVLAPLHSVPSSFSLHLPVFCALTSLPPALCVQC